MQLNKAKRIIPIILIGSISIAFIADLYGQEISVNGIKYSYNERHVMKEISFYNSSTSPSVRKFDIYSHNPFQNLGFTIDTLNEIGFSVYKLRPDEFEKLYEMFPMLKRIFSGSLYLTSYFDYDPYSDYIPVSYLLTLSDQANHFQYISTIFILDKSGETVFKLENEPLDCSSVSITQNGKYLGFVFGTIQGENGLMSDLSGYKIYDIDRKQLRYYETCEKEIELPLGSSIVGNKMCFSFLRDSSRYRYLVFDLEKGIKYSKIFSTNEMGNLVDMDDSGVIFQKENVRQEKKYQEYFDAEKF